jgi:hypothetical protein
MKRRFDAGETPASKNDKTPAPTTYGHKFEFGIAQKEARHDSKHDELLF